MGSRGIASWLVDVSEEEVVSLPWDLWRGGAVLLSTGIPVSTGPLREVSMVILPSIAPKEDVSVCPRGLRDGVCGAV